jgi:hypothetical protein
MRENVRREPVFSVMAAGWFWESGGCESGALEKNNGFQSATILRRRIFTQINYEIGGLHPV